MLTAKAKCRNAPPLSSRNDRNYQESYPAGPHTLPRTIFFALVISSQKGSLYKKPATKRRAHGSSRRGWLRLPKSVHILTDQNLQLLEGSRIGSHRHAPPLANA